MTQFKPCAFLHLWSGKCFFAIRLPLTVLIENKLWIEINDKQLYQERELNI